MVLIVIIVFTLIALMQIPGLIQKKYWPELAVFSILFFMGFGLSILLVSGVQLPFVSDAIRQGIRNILGLK